MSLNRKSLLAILLVVAWLGVLLAAFWSFQGRYLRPYPSSTQLFQGEGLQLPAELAGPGPIRLVHFWDPGCPCNVANQQHLASLVARFQSQGVAFYAVRRPGTQGRLADELWGMKELKDFPLTPLVPASPAVAVWDRQGRLAYFGPYSEGATCTSANSFIEPVLEALVAGRTVRANSALASGCYCDWH
ncbi:DUF6436 domain-containing protein [Pseudomonas panipatensis]|uniref:DUF6436 domain-containing protein n=1 Tax=Pseudomonas panipatensis TaxID=428992 RepID=A0A1G8FTT1_9PSED|nr:DUF6436 domain-containing protein [Pseudomonas panipatensis]SDH85497.1 hypothetical protein SAMN05216272_103449 [Pseudomonas panipatensis]SMP52335.1 hypothetical protein SAMN06295951_10310 [Pseudomonas panipatensis]